MSALRIGGFVLLGIVLLIAALAALAFKPDRSLESLKPRWAKPPSQFIALDGMQVHLRDEGVRDDPVPIILLHGTASSLYSWQGWTDRLKGAHRVIRFDRPGFGLTGPNPSGDYTMRFYADFLAQLMDKLGVKRAIIAGNSSGGNMAWEFAARYPDRVAGLILVDAGGYPRTTPLPAGLQMAMSPWAKPLVDNILPRSEVERGLRTMFGDPARFKPEMVDVYYELTLRAGNRKVLGETLRQNLSVDNSAQIATIKTPTLILWGAKDTVIPMVPDAERFHHDIAGSELVVLPDVGHLGHEEDPIATLAPVEAFLAKVDAHSHS